MYSHQIIYVGNEVSHINLYCGSERIAVMDPTDKTVRFLPTNNKASLKRQDIIRKNYTNYKVIEGR